MVLVLRNSGKIKSFEIMGAWYLDLEAKAIAEHAMREMKRLDALYIAELNDTRRRAYSLRFAKWNLWLIEFLIATK